MENRSDPFLWPLLCLAIPVFFLWLGANTIWDANEAFYVETPRQMLQSGDYVAPSFNGEPRVNKPILSYWIVAAFYHLFGVSVGVERLAIALGAMLIILSAFLIGRALRSTATGVLAALIVASAPRVVMHSRRIFIDVYITAFTSLALAGFVLAERHPERRRWYLLLTYLALGAGAAIKGPAYVILAAAACLIWLAIEGRLGDLRRLHVVPGALTILACVATWHVPDALQHGWPAAWTHMRQFYLGENLVRAASSVTGDRPVFFYVQVLLTDLLPWALLLLVPLTTAWRRGAATSPIRRLLWIWIVTITGAFSLAQSKQDLYIFPVVAAAAVLIADTLAATGYGARHRGVRALLATSAGLVSAAGLVIGWLFTSGYYALDGARLASAVAIGTGLVSLGLVMRSRPAAAVTTLAGGMIAFNYLFVVALLPSTERLKPVPTLARAFHARATARAQIGQYSYSLPSVTYYLNRRVEDISAVGHATAFFADNHESYAMMRQATFEMLRATGLPLCIAARHPAFTFEPGLLVQGQPPEDVLLVTNQCGAIR